MQLFWRALNAINDGLAGAPAPVRTGAMVAFAIGLLVAWALISSRRPKLGLALNVAIIALVVVDVLAVRGEPPPRGEPGGGIILMKSLFWGGEAIITLLGLIGAAAAVVKLAEKPEQEAGEAADLPAARHPRRSRS